MAKITTSAGLNVGTELVVHLGFPETTIELVAIGNLVAKDGVTMQALYTKLLKLWETLPYGHYPFPVEAIDARSGQWSWGTDSNYFNGSGPHNDATRRMIRDAGWSEFDAAGVLQREYVGVRSFGSLANPSTQAYYLTAPSGSPTNFVYTGPPNQAVKVFDLGTGLDERTFLKVFAREEGYTYDSKDLAAVNETASGPFVLTMNLDSVADTNIMDNDATVSGSAPYTGVTATWLVGSGFSNAVVGSLAVGDVRKHGNGRWSICTGAGTLDAAGVANYTANGGTATLTAFSGERDVNGTYYAYNVIVAGNGTTTQKIYTKLRYLLRQNSDIDSGAGTKIGKITDALTQFVGSQLVTAPGVYIDNFSGDQTKVTHTDVLGVGHALPLITNQSVTVTGGVAGTRIQIYDLTHGVELYNGVPATWPHVWTDASPYVSDRQIRVRAAYVSGISAKEFIDQTIGTATAIQYALTYALPQIDDAVYNANAINGPAVTNVTMDEGSSRIRLGASRSTQQVYAASMAHLFTSAGIAGFGQVVTAVDRANYFIRSWKVKNVIAGGTTPLEITDGWLRDTVTGKAITTHDQTGGPIYNAPDHIVEFVAGGALTPEAIAAEVWDSARDDHNTPGSFGASVAATEDNTDIMLPKVDELA